MKLKILFSLLTAEVLFSLACNKQNSIVVPTPTSAVNIVNASVNSSPLVPNFSNDTIKWFANAQTIGYGSSFEYSVASGNNVILAISQTSDTATVIFKASLNLKPRGIYSLFYCGEPSQNGADTLFIEDQIPFYGITDSVVGVRFVNLVFGNTAISVNIQGDSVGSEIASLRYKGVSNFKSYPATSDVVSGYTFEIRDAVSGTLLSTFTYSSFILFKNVTLVISGDDHDLSNVKVNSFLINNF